jgi:DNA primase
MLLDLIENDGLNPKKKTANEFASSCPVCGGDDRFLIFTETNKYWCRQCNRSGDSIQYLRDFHGMTFQDASAAIGKDISAENHRTVFPSCRAKVAEQKKEQPAVWTEQAKKLVTAAHTTLMNSGALEWLKSERGISEDTAKRFSLGWIPADQWREKTEWGIEPDGKKMYFPKGLVIPLEKAVKIRREDPGNYARYYLVPGSVSTPLVIGAPCETTAIIVESELDAILLSQEIKRKVLIVSLGSCSNKPDDSLLEKLSLCPVILVALDSDGPGAKASRWWVENVPSSFRAPLIHGTDLTESFMNGVDLNVWLSAALTLYSEENP